MHVRAAIPYNVVHNVPTLKVEKNDDFTYIKKGDLYKLFKAFRSLPLGIRDLFLAQLSSYLGLTIKESLNLDIDHINFVDSILYVPSRKESLYMPEPLRETCRQYLSLRKKILQDTSTNTRHLFVNYTGTLYNRRSFEKQFKKAIELTDLPLNLTPRHLRSSFGVYMSEVLTPEELQKVMNQKTVSKFYKKEITRNPLIS